MKISLVVNTACADAMTAGKRNPYRQTRYGARAELLRTKLLPSTQAFDEVIVAGVYPAGLVEEFPNVHWINVPPLRRNRWDGLLQRETGARFATGDILVFCHDDHAPEPSMPNKLEVLPVEWDILCPKRVHATTGEELNNGRADNYMGSHCYAMQRWIWASLPLTSAPDEWWDIWMTPRWRALGARIVWTDDIIHYDHEATEAEK